MMSDLSYSDYTERRPRCRAACFHSISQAEGVAAALGYTDYTLKRWGDREFSITLTYTSMDGNTGCQEEIKRGDYIVMMPGGKAKIVPGAEFTDVWEMMNNTTWPPTFGISGGLLTNTTATTTNGV
jgi:hypothetical protein